MIVNGRGKKLIGKFGSDTWVDVYLHDWLTAKYYENSMDAYSEDPLKLAKCGSHIWKSEPGNDPIELLMFAIVRQAVEDYADAWRKDDIIYCNRLERDFFSQYDETQTVLNVLKEKLKKSPRWSKCYSSRSFTY